jgi:hypothetical protein
MVADAIWRGIGTCGNYIEPFAGSLAVLLARPDGAAGVETINDADGLLANFWRAIRSCPDEVAKHTDWPVNEADLTARHLWLIGQRESLTDRLMADPDWCDAKAAGWWVWGLSCWIGGGWCSGFGPWRAIDGVLVNTGTGVGVYRKLPHIGGTGKGVHREMPRIHDHGGTATPLAAWFATLSARLRNVRVACGDWSRVCGDSVLDSGSGATGIVLDPPYADGDADYAIGCGKVWLDVCAFAVEVGKRRDVRVALCGYDGTFEPPSGWRTHVWKAQGGYGNRSDGDGRVNANRERVWFSPACALPVQATLF